MKMIFKLLRYAIVALLLISLQLDLHAQDDIDDDHNVSVDVPEVALLDLESATGTSIVLNVEAPTEAGLPVTFNNAVDSSIWVNYSSVVGSNTEPSRSVYAKISAGSLPDGLRVMVRASNDAGQGDGDVGTTNGRRRLGPADKLIIKDIGTSYTGDGPNKGHMLKYELELRPTHTYGMIDFDQATTLTILYTITNN